MRAAWEVLRLLNVIWLVLILAGVVAAAAAGKPGMITQAATGAARASVEIALELAGLMGLWLGLVRIAEEAGLMQKVAGLLAPLARLLFPEIPREHPAIGAMAMNISANLLGLGSAATPLGLKAMQELQALNPKEDEASPAMITFLVLNTSSVTLVPGTLIALRAAAGSRAPSEIVVPALLATLVSAIVALSLNAIFRWVWLQRRGD